MSRYQSAKGRTGAGEGRGKPVLVVDDEPGVRTLIARLLSRAGYIVDVARDGAEAWSLLPSKPYVALILDLRMPGGAGETLYQQLKRVDELLAQRVIFITGDPASPGGRGFATATGNPMIDEPFDLKTLQQQLQKLLRGEI